MVERERGMDVLAMRAQPMMNAPSTRMAWVMWRGRLKRSAKVKKLSMSFMVIERCGVSIQQSWSCRGQIDVGDQAGRKSQMKRNSKYTCLVLLAQ